MNETKYLFIGRPPSVTFDEEYRRINRFIKGIGNFALTKVPDGFILAATEDQIMVLLDGALQESAKNNSSKHTLTLP